MFKVIAFSTITTALCVSLALNYAFIAGLVRLEDEQPAYVSEDGSYTNEARSSMGKIQELYGN